VLDPQFNATAEPAIWRRRRAGWLARRAGTATCGPERDGFNPVRVMQAIASNVPGASCSPDGKSQWQSQRESQANGTVFFAAGRGSTGAARQESLPPILQIAVYCKSCTFVHRLGCRWEGETPVEPRGKGCSCRHPFSSPFSLKYHWRLTSRRFPLLMAQEP